MKNLAPNTSISKQKDAKKASGKTAIVRPDQIDYKKEKDILLALSNDLTKVRDKNDLITLFKKGIKGLFHITHTIVTLIDYKDETYTPFLLDNDGSPIRSHSRYGEMVQAHFSLNEPFIQTVLAANAPISFALEDIMDKPDSPPFLRVNYEKGVREILMTKLMKEGKPMGFLHIYSDKPDGFSEEFRSVITGIVPQISSAVSNILKNEDILRREKEKSFLLDFSSDIATIRTKEELAHAVRTVLRELNPDGSFVIRRINEDNSTMSPYVFDVKTTDPKIIAALQNSRFPINDGLQNRILNSSIPVSFNVDREIVRGIPSAYLQYWKEMGMSNLVGVRLRNGATNHGILVLHTEQINIPLLQGICAQISIAIGNITANEQINKTQEEQAFLLDFSHDITRVRTREDLQNAIFTVLDKTMQTKLAMIRVIDDDGIHLSPFMFDRTLFGSTAKADFDKMSTHAISINETYTAQVLASQSGMVFNVAEEIKSGNDYAKLWKTTGLKNMYALPLRVGNKPIGTIWMLANRLSALLVKGICAQIATAIANIKANERLEAYKKTLEVENYYLTEQIKTIYNFSEIIGSGEPMKKVYQLISLVAGSNTTVLVTGETGTGKELIARAIHNASPRSDKLMVKVNCAALPASLIESELFGHERGAFTGAIDKRIGKFELANNSTLFLDEIGELPLDAQAKLLRVIQERELERIGGKQTIKIDVRLIVATNRDLDAEVKAGRFRADLYFRLNIFPIHLPPLRDRSEDIEALAHFFIQKHSRNTGRNIKKIVPAVMHKLRAYTWPGNVRELEHLLERSVLLATNGILDDVHIPQHNDLTTGHEQAYQLNRSLDEVERDYIIETLKRCGGKISGTGSAAEILQIPGNTLHSKMKKLGITKTDYFN